MFWSPVERHIDQIAHLIYDRLSNNSKPRRKPLSLSDKLKFIKKHISQKIDIEKLSIQTLAASKVRDVCVHGCIDAYDDVQMKIGKVDGRQQNHVIEIFTFDRARLEKSATDLAALQKTWEEIALSLLHSSNNGASKG